MSALEDARETERWLRANGEGIDADRVAALIAEHERLTAPPTDDEREALDQIIRDADGYWPDARDAILAAGFRLTAPPTDDEIRAKTIDELAESYVYVHAVNRTTSRVYQWLRARAEAARAVR